VTVESAPRGGAQDPRYLFAGLIASLALNLLFVGGIAAGAWHHRFGGRHGETGLMSFANDLAEPHRQTIRDMVTTARESMRPQRQAMRRAWDEANATLTVEPFDKEKFKAAMEHVSEAENAYKVAVTTVLASIAEKLTPEERKELQQWRDKRRPKIFRRHHGPDDPGKSPYEEKDD
jgi:Spy/CpxP family protein refolding chaperone